MRDTIYVKTNYSEWWRVGDKYSIHRFENEAMSLDDRKTNNFTNCIGYFLLHDALQLPTFSTNIIYCRLAVDCTQEHSNVCFPCELWHNLYAPILIFSHTF